MKNKLLYFGLLVVTLYLAIIYDSPMLLGFGDGNGTALAIPAF